MGRYTPAPGHNVKLPVSLYASAVKAAEFRRMNVGKWVEMAVESQLSRDYHAYNVERYETRQRASADRRMPGPSPTEFGLPEDYGIPPAFKNPRG